MLQQEEELRPLTWLCSVSDSIFACCRVMQQNQQYIPQVLAVFLGESGMGHPDEVSCPAVSLSPFAAIMYALSFSFSEQ